MNRPLKELNQILEYRLKELRLFGRAEQKGPILNVLIERLPGDQVNIPLLMELVKAAVDASLVPRIRKVNVYIWSRAQSEAEAPEWSGSFTYQPMADLLQQDTEPFATFRQDYAGIRILFFGLAAALSLLYVWAEFNLLTLIPSLLALGLGISFPLAKRQIKASVDLLFRRIGLGIGIMLVVISMMLLWPNQLDRYLFYSPLLLLGIWLIGIGL